MRGQTVSKWTGTGRCSRACDVCVCTRIIRIPLSILASCDCLPLLLFPFTSQHSFIHSFIHMRVLSGPLSACADHLCLLPASQLLPLHTLPSLPFSNSLVLVAASRHQPTVRHPTTRTSQFISFQFRAQLTTAEQGRPRRGSGKNKQQQQRQMSRASETRRRRRECNAKRQ